MRHTTKTEKIVAVRTGPREMEEKSRLFFLFTPVQVEEVLPEMSTRPVPFAPSFLQGVALWRGHLLPVVDLEKLFALEDGERKRQGRFIVTCTGVPENPAGEQILRCVLRLSDEIHSMEVPASGSMVTSELIGVDPFLARGIYQCDEDVYIVPDLATILQNQQSIDR